LLQGQNVRKKVSQYFIICESLKRQSLTLKNRILVIALFLSISSCWKLSAQAVQPEMPTYDEFRRTELIRSVLDYDEKAFNKVLVSQVKWINLRDQFGMTALMYAAAHGHERLFQRLLRMNANPTIKDFADETVMHKFARVSTLAPIGYLILKGVPVDVANKHGMNPLHIASVGWNFIQMERFVEHGVNVNIQNSQSETALHLVVKQFKAADSLNKIALNTELKPPKKQTGFWLLSKDRIYAFGNWIKNIPSRIYQIYKPEPPVLRDEKDGVKAAELLLNKQASLKLRDNQGFTVIDIVKQKKNIQLLKLFIARGLLKESDI